MLAMPVRAVMAVGKVTMSPGDSLDRVPHAATAPSSVRKPIKNNLFTSLRRTETANGLQVRSAR
jgi:hypothetical protein